MLSLGGIDAVEHMYGFQPKSITVATHVSGLKIIADGVTYTAPQRFDWKPGTTHSLEVLAEQVQGDTHYEFGRWNDDGDVSHTITVSRDRTLYTANFIPSGKDQGQEIYSPATLPLRRIEAIGDSAAECVEQLKARGLDPANFEFSRLGPPY